MKNNVSVELAKQLKKIGFNLPTKDCYFWSHLEENGSGESIWELKENLSSSGDLVCYNLPSNSYYFQFDCTELNWIDDRYIIQGGGSENYEGINWNNDKLENLEHFEITEKKYTKSKINKLKKMFIYFEDLNEMSEYEYKRLNEEFYLFFKKYPDIFNDIFGYDINEVNLEEEEFILCIPELISAPTYIDVMYWLKKEYSIDINIITEDGILYKGNTIGKYRTEATGNSWLACLESVLENILLYLEILND